MKVYVETNPETIYSGRVKDEVKTTEIRMWFETDEEIEVLSLTDYTKQVRKEVCEEIIKSIHYYPIALLDIDKEPRIKTLGISKEVLDTILKEYQK